MSDRQNRRVWPPGLICERICRDIGSTKMGSWPTKSPTRLLTGDDLVAFLLGCSFTFEWALLEAGIDLWHVKHGKNVAMWRTSTPCRPAGIFHGPMVVSMRPIPSSQLSKAVTASARFPGAHGAPVHIGDPAAIGIADVTKPEWGDPQPFAPGDVPVFWACGVTPQAVALASKPPFMLTHSPGHMFITDLPNAALAAF